MNISKRQAISTPPLRKLPMLIVIGACFLLHVIVGFFVKPYIEGDETLYLEMSRQIATHLDHSIKPLTWYEDAPPNSFVPNFLYPAILAIFQLGHQYETLRFMNIIFQSISLVVGSLILYKIARRVDQNIGRREAAFLILASNVYPYSNFSGYFLTEPVYYATFLLFVLIVVVMIQKKSHAIINIGEDIAIGVIFALSYYIKIVFLWVLPIYLFTFILFSIFSYRSRHDLLLVLKSCALAATSWGMTLLIIHHLGGQSLLGFYEPNIAAYNLRNLPDVLLTWLGQSLFLFGYSAFLAVAAFLAAGYEVLILVKERSQLPVRSIVFLLTAVSFLIIPTILAVHSVSNIEWGYGRRDWYIFQERVYGFMIPLSFLNIVLYSRKLGRFLSWRTLVLITFFVVTYLFIETRTLEPGSARITGLAFAFPQLLHIPHKYVVTVPLLLFAVICLLTNLIVHKSRFNLEAISRFSYIAIIGLLCSFKFAHAAFVTSLHVNEYKNISEISSYFSKHSDSTLFILKDDLRTAKTLFFTRDNRLDYKVLSSWNDNLVSTCNPSRQKSFLLVTGYVNAAIFDRESNLIETANGPFFVLPSLDLLSMIAVYRHPTTRVTFPLIGGIPTHLNRSDIDMNPWIEIVGPARYKMHPGDELDVGFVMTNASCETLIASLSYSAQMLENTALTNGVLIRVEKEEILDQAVVKGDGIPILGEVTLSLLPNEEVRFFVNSRGNANYDATMVEISYTSIRLTGLSK